MNTQTHYLLDETGQAVLSGSEAEMRAELAWLEENGHLGCLVVPEDQGWHWESVDWGD